MQSFPDFPLKKKGINVIRLEENSTLDIAFGTRRHIRLKNHLPYVLCYTVFA